MKNSWSEQGRQRTAIVTGSASGLGRALALALARRGWRLALVDQSQAANEETRKLAEQLGGLASTAALDVGEERGWVELRDRLQAEWPQLDLLVCNAGVAGAGEVGEFPIEDWDWLLRTNLRGVVVGCHTMLPWLKQTPGSHIINTGSLAAIGGAPAMGAYCVSKAAVVALSETMYVELKQHGVGVTVLCPSFFDTNLLIGSRCHREPQRRTAERWMRSAGFTADDVAEAALRAMRRKNLYVVMGAKARWIWRAKRLMPRTFLRLLAAWYRRGTMVPDDPTDAKD